MIRAVLASCIVFAGLHLTVQAETIVAKGKIWTGTDEGVIEDGVVIIEDGEISQIGDADTDIPEDATIIGANGSWITPGVIVPFSRLGIVEVAGESSTDDRGGASERYAVSMRAADGFNPAATSIPVTRIEGVTHAAIAPRASHSIIAGLGFIADTSGNSDSIEDSAAFLFVEIGETGAQRAGGSRSAAWSYLRGALAEGESRRIRSYRVAPTNLLSERDADVMAQVISGRIKLLFHAHRASDLLKIIDLQDDYRNLDMVVVGATEGWMVAEELAEAEIPVIIDPFDNLPASFESLAATQQNSKRLIDAGVITAFAHLADDGHQPRLGLQVAGNAIANGVSYDDALAAVTTVPAEIFDLDDFGALERGADAHLVVWDGDPLEITSSPQSVIIGGSVQPLHSRQTRLRDRYLSLEKDERPFGYKRPN